jgi:hypothetical protein
MSLKWVSEDELDQLGNARLAQDMLPIRMVVVTGTFPYRKQLEEFRRALRFDSIDALLNDPYAIPEFMGIDVQRREIPSTGEPGPWDDVDILESIRQLRIKAVGLVPEDVELENYGIIVQPNRLVMPRPQLARGNYPDSKLPGVRETIATLQKSNEADLPPPPVAKSRFEGLDPWSMDQPNTPSSTTNAREGAGASEGMGRRRTSGSGQTGAAAGGAARTDAPARAPAAMTAAKSYNPPDKCLLRFLDVTVEPGKTYEYRVKVKVANPSYGKENLAVSKEAAALAVLEAPEWREVTRRVGEDDVPLRVRVSDELMYYATDEKIDRAAPANADRAAVQIHRWLDEVRVNPSDQSSVTRVGDWTVLERILLHRGEYIGKQQEVDVAVWRTTLGRFGLAGHGEDALPRLPNQPRPPRQKGVVVDFATDPVAYQPSILVDFEGGKRSVTTSEGKNITDESPVEMLVLNADGKLIVRDSTKDTQDRQRQERYAAWKRELAPLKARDEGKPNPDDNLFQRGDPAGARRRS